MEKFLNFVVNNQNTIPAVLIALLIIVIVLTIIFSKKPDGSSSDKKVVNRDWSRVESYDVDSPEQKEWRQLHDDPARHRRGDDIDRNRFGGL